jgi:putative Holliday junction resolvase
MRILALDHGTKRIGVAISDELGMIAQPLEFIPAHPLEEAFVRLKQIIEEKSVDEIIVGMPRNMNGTLGPAADKANEFIAQIKERFPQPVRDWDERLTTVQAQRILIEGGTRRNKRKEKVDMMAAAILLQSYLDSKTF